MAEKLKTGIALTLDLNGKIKPFPRETYLVKKFYAAAGFYFANGRLEVNRQEAMRAYRAARKELINELKEGE